MAYSNRKEIIRKIEKLRGSKVITYVVSTRPFINTMIEPGDIRILLDHLEKNGKIDLFIYSNGGNASVAWPLVNLIREYSEKFSVLVPYNAFSCATSISIGADEIVMGKVGTLGPIDPKVSNEFNPTINNQPIGISVEDIAGFFDLIKTKFGIKRQQLLSKHFEQLSSDIRPLALGNAYRHYIKARDDAKKILSLHMDPKKDKTKINNIIEILVEKLHFHGHNINRKEAKDIGLNVIRADEVSDGEINLEDLIWDLYKDYEEELKLKVPYRDEAPSSGETINLPIKFIESAKKSNKFNIKQNWIQLNFPDNSYMINNNGQIAVYNSTTGIVIPVIFSGQPVSLNGKIYDKIESLEWE